MFSLRITALLAALLCCGPVIAQPTLSQTVTARISTDNLRQYAYGVGSESDAFIDRNGRFTRPDKTIDVFDYTGSSTQNLAIYLQDSAETDVAVKDISHRFSKCTGTNSAQSCAMQMGLPTMSPLSLKGIQKLNVNMKPGERLLLTTVRKDDGSAEIDIELQSRGTRTLVSQHFVQNLMVMNFIAPSNLQGNRAASQLGGFNGQPTALLSASLRDNDSMFARACQGAQSLSGAAVDTLLAATILLSPAEAYAQAAGGGSARMYVMNGYGQGRDNGADTFAGEMKAAGDAINRNGGDLDVRQILYDEGFINAPGLCEMAKKLAEAICKDLEEDPLEDGEKLVIAGHSFGGLIALTMRNSDCLPDCFTDQTFDVFAYDPPLNGVPALGWIPILNDRGNDMAPGSTVLTEAREAGERSDTKIRMRKDGNGNEPPFGTPGEELGEDVPDHDPYRDEERGGNRDREANKKERKEVLKTLINCVLGL